MITEVLEQNKDVIIKSYLEGKSFRLDLLRRHNLHAKKIRQISRVTKFGVRINRKRFHDKIYKN